MADGDRRTVPLAAAVGVALAIAGGWWWTRGAAPEPAAPPERSEAQAPASEGPPAAGPEAAAVTGAEDAPTLVSGTTLALERDALPADGPLVVHLDLGEPSADAEPRPVRVYATDGRRLELSGRLDASRRKARVDLDPAFLAPGRYLVEVKTTEESHFPLRRYVIEVR